MPLREVTILDTAGCLGSRPRAKRVLFPNSKRYKDGCVTVLIVPVVRVQDRYGEINPVSMRIDVVRNDGVHSAQMMVDNGSRG
jgi:hypothetical protein